MAARRIRLSGDRGEVGLAVDGIRRGAVVVLPTETVYGLAVSPRLPGARRAAMALKGRDAGQHLTHHLADRRDLEVLAPPPPDRVERLIQRFWPGPLTVILKGLTEATVGLRLPAHAFVRQVIRTLGHSLLMTSVNRTAQPPLCDAEAILAAFGDRIDLLFDDGPSVLKMPSTVVRCTEPVLEVLREGVLTAEEIYLSAARTVLFVCSGNTCRSPMAAALARRRIAAVLGVAQADLLAAGVHVASAGTSTLSGLPASEGARQALAEVGLDASAHRSRALDPDLARRSARIFCLASSHRERVLELVPHLGPRTGLLHPDGLEIADPFGGDLQTYRETRDQIAAALDRRIDSLVALVRST